MGLRIVYIFILQTVTTWTRRDCGSAVESGRFLGHTRVTQPARTSPLFSRRRYTALTNWLGFRLLFSSLSKHLESDGLNKQYYLLPWHHKPTALEMRALESLQTHLFPIKVRATEGTLSHVDATSKISSHLFTQNDCVNASKCGH